MWYNRDEMLLLLFAPPGGCLMAVNVLPMQAVVETNQVDKNMNQLLHRVQSGKEYVVFKESGHNIAALIGISDFEEFRRWRAKRILHELGRELGAQLEAEGVDEEQLIQEMKEIRKEVFQEQYGTLV